MSITNEGGWLGRLGNWSWAVVAAAMVLPLLAQAAVVLALPLAVVLVSDRVREAYVTDQNPKKGDTIVAILVTALVVMILVAADQYL